MRNVVIFPLERWPGGDPEAVYREAAHELTSEDHLRVLNRYAQGFGRHLSRMGFNRHDRRDALDRWYDAVADAGDRLYGDAPGQDAS